jgi:serine protease Do
MDSIIDHGKVIRGWLGVSIQNLTPELAKSLGIKETEGALIAGIEPNSPADKAGFKRRDLVVEFNGNKVLDSTSLRNMVSSAPPGKKVDFKIIRDGKKQNMTATLGEYKEKKTAKKTEYNNVLKEVTVQELTPDLQEKLNLPENLGGVVVTEVGPDSPAQGLLQPGDVIQEINKRTIRSAQDYDKAVSKLGEHDTVLLLIYREGGSIYLTIKS